MNKFLALVEDPVYQDDNMQNLGRAKRALNNEKKKIKVLQSDLILLQDIVRTYLKIEWEIERKGK